MPIQVTEQHLTLQEADPQRLEVVEAEGRVVETDGQVVIVTEERVQTLELVERVLVTEERVHIIEGASATGAQGPAGPGVPLNGPLADRPDAGTYEGQQYIATDTDEVFAWHG